MLLEHINSPQFDLFERNQALRDRSLGAALGQLFMLAVLGANSPIFTSQFNISWIYGSLVLFPNLIRIWMCRPAMKESEVLKSTAWLKTFSALLLLIALGWGLTIHHVFQMHGVSHFNSLLGFMFLAGLTAGAGTSLSPFQKLAQAFTFLVLVFPTYDLATSGEPQKQVLASICFFYFLFVQSQIKVQSDSYKMMKERENQFRLLASSSFEGVAVHSGGSFLEVNTAYASLFGYTRSEMIGMPVSQIMPPEEADRLKNIIKTNFQGIYETQLLRRDGSRFYAEGIGRTTLYQGKSARINCMRDITERIVAEELRQNAERKLVEMAFSREKVAIESNKLKSEFLANISHEIRTPLNGIIGTSELLLELPLGSEQRKYSSVIRNSAESLLSIINDLLDFSKIEAGKLNLEMMEFSLVDLVEGQIEILSAKAHEKKISLLAHVDPALPAYLIGDPGRIGQILLNLVGNAIKFTEKGSVTVWVKAGKTEGQKLEVQFIVRDTGVGIEPGTIEKLFQPFIQADGSTARKFGGTGLGLSICKQLAKLMGGEIGVLSSPGTGSEFWFTSTLTATHKAATEDRESLPGLKVLVRVSDPNLKDILVSYLNSWRMNTQVIDQDDSPLLNERFDWLVISEDELNRNFNPRPEQTLLIREFNTLPYLNVKGMPVATVMKPIKQSNLYDQLVTLGHIQRKLPEVAALSDSDENVSAPLKQKRILIAEDNSVNQMVAKANLQKLGYWFRVVENGVEALKALEEESFDLILMDCQMPELDGYQTTQTIREMEKKTLKHLPIIALTANAMKEDAQKCLDSGMDDYLSKPFRREGLEAKLKKWLS